MPIDYGTNDISTSGILKTSFINYKSTTPASADFINLYCYNRWMLGADEIFYSSSEGSYDKWGAAAATDSEGVITLTLKAASIFGQTIKEEHLGQEVTVGDVALGVDPVGYRNDGDGIAVTTHVDFINSLFTEFDLKSTMKTHPTKCKINFCKLDKFVFVIEETGESGVTDLVFPNIYVLSTVEPWGLRDRIVENLYYWQNDGGSLWTDIP